MLPRRHGEPAPPPPAPPPPPSPSSPLDPSQPPLPAQPLQHFTPLPHLPYFCPPVPPSPPLPLLHLETPDPDSIPPVSQSRHRHSNGPAPFLTSSSQEPLRLLEVLDSMERLGFTSFSDFLIRLFGSDDPAVRRRVNLFYTHDGVKSLMDIFMNSKRARENGGDEIAVSWAGAVFKDEFEIGLVKGGVNVDVRANSNESRGRTSGEILKEGLETFDLASVQRLCERKAPLLWRLLETLSSSDRERVDNKVPAVPPADATADEPDQEPPPKRRKTDGSYPVMGSPSNPPLTITVMLLLLASSQVRNKFQKWLGLYLYAQGVRKGPLNSLRTLGVGSEGKVIGDNVLRVIGDDTKKKLRAELGGSVQQGQGTPRATSRASKRRSTAAEIEATNFGGVNPLEGKRLFVISQVTYHPTAKDHLKADNFAPCATIPFVFKLPPSTPVLTKAMVKTSTAFRCERYLTSPADLSVPAPFVGTIIGGDPEPPVEFFPSGAYYAFDFAQSALDTTPGYDSPSNGEYIFPGPTWPEGAPAPAVPTEGIGSNDTTSGSKLLAADKEGRSFWKSQSRRMVWRAMKRLWPKIEEILGEDEVTDERPPHRIWPRPSPDTQARDEAGASMGGGNPAQVTEDDLVPMPSMKRVSTQKTEDQMSVLNMITEYLGVKTEHLKGPDGDRLWLWAGNLEFVLALRKATLAASEASVLHNIHPVLQLFDIRQHFLLELLRQHYGKPNDKDPTSLCHHLHVMGRKFIIFGFSVCGQYAEGLLLHSLESHLIDSILTVTTIRESGPKTKAEALEIISKVYDSFLDPEVVRKLQETTDQASRDEWLENHMLLMQHSLVYLTLLESIASASTTSLIHVLVWLATAYQSLRHTTSRYLGRELFELVAGLLHEWSPELRQAVLDSMLVPKSPGAPFPTLSSHPACPQIPGRFQEVDFAMKQLLRQTKTVFDLRDNPKHDFFREVAAPNIKTISKVVRNAEESLGTAPRTANQWKSPAESVDPDKEIPRLVKELREARIAEHDPGRVGSSKVVNMFRDGEDRVRSADFLEAFIRRGDSAAISADAPDPDVEEKTEWKRRNLFFAEDFGFDWGV